MNKPTSIFTLFAVVQIPNPAFTAELITKPDLEALKLMEKVSWRRKE